MQHEAADACTYGNPTSGCPDQDAATKAARLNSAIPLREELIVKVGDGFVVANLIKAKLGGDALLQEPQRGLLDPGRKVETRQQYGRPLKLATEL